MAAPLKAPKSKSAPIDGEQFRYGLRQIDMGPDRFAKLFCNGRLSRVQEWLNNEVPVSPWVPALLAAMMTTEARARAIATAEHLIATAVAEEDKR